MSLRRLVLPLIVCLAAAFTVAAPASATTHPQVRRGHAHCLPLHATGVGQDLGGGQTAATLSVRGVEVGTTAAAFTISGVDGNLASFSGPLVFTGLGGTLTAQVSGTLDVTTGAFTSTSSSLTGTGLLRGVTGELTFTGTEDLGTGAFTERVDGRLCAPAYH